jgi:hypothetical protein
MNDAAGNATTKDTNSDTMHSNAYTRPGAREPNATLMAQRLSPIA